MSGQWELHWFSKQLGELGLQWETWGQSGRPGPVHTFTYRKRFPVVLANLQLLSWADLLALLEPDCPDGTAVSKTAPNSDARLRSLLIRMWDRLSVGVRLD